MENLFNIVSDVPLDEKPEDTPKCPYCDSEHLTKEDEITTLLGWLGKVNPNHIWNYYFCIECKQRFIREIKESNVWYTDKRGPGHVLKGMPSCFENYIYHCAKCGEEVHRYTTKLDGVTPSTGFGVATNSDGIMVKQYRVFYKCASCGHGGEVATDHWSP